MTTTAAKRSSVPALAQHRYRGGRYRPENATTASLPESRRHQVRRGTCRHCGGGKAAHEFAAKGRMRQ